MLTKAVIGPVNRLSFVVEQWTWGVERWKDSRWHLVGGVEDFNLKNPVLRLIVFVVRELPVAQIA